MLLLDLLLFHATDIFGLDIIFKTINFSPLFASNDTDNIIPFMLICFISVLSWSIVHLAATDQKLPELNPTTEETHRGKRAEKNNYRSDIVLSDLEESSLKFIYDQYNANGVIFIRKV